MANTIRAIYADDKVEISHNLERGRFVVLNPVSGKTVEVFDTAKLVELGSNAVEACRRAGIDPSTKLVPDGYPVILPREVREAWEEAKRARDAELDRISDETEAAMDPELVAALGRFGSSKAAYKAEAMRAYQILYTAGY